VAGIIAPVCLKMVLAMGSGGGSGDEQEASNTRKGKKSYHRHTSHQIEQLET
jgi:hypothetical protein